MLCCTYVDLLSLADWPIARWCKGCFINTQHTHKRARARRSHGGGDTSGRHRRRAKIRERSAVFEPAGAAARRVMSWAANHFSLSTIDGQSRKGRASLPSCLLPLARPFPAESETKGVSYRQLVDCVAVRDPPPPLLNFPSSLKRDYKRRRFSRRAYNKWPTCGATRAKWARSALGARRQARQQCVDKRACKMQMHSRVAIVWPRCNRGASNAALMHVGPAALQRRGSQPRRFDSSRKIGNGRFVV